MNADAVSNGAEPGVETACRASKNCNVWPAYVNDECHDACFLPLYETNVRSSPPSITKVETSRPKPQHANKRNDAYSWIAEGLLKHIAPFQHRGRKALRGTTTLSEDQTSG